MIKSRRWKWAGYVVRMEEGKNTYKSLTDEPKREKGLKEENVRWFLKKYSTYQCEELGLLSPEDRDYWRSLLNAPMDLR